MTKNQKILRVLSSFYFWAITLFVVIGPQFIWIENHPKSHFVWTQFSTFDTALEMFETDVGRYPTTREGLQLLSSYAPPADIAKNWNGPYLRIEPPLDPWGNPYRYTYPGIHQKKPYDLVSAGSDGILGSDDDLANWVDVTRWKNNAPRLSWKIYYQAFYEGMDYFLGPSLLWLILIAWAASGVYMVMRLLAWLLRRQPGNRSPLPPPEAQADPEDQNAPLDFHTR